MATDIGNVYLDVYADTSALKRQIRRAAQQAGKDFGKDFEKSAAPGLSRLGDRLSASMDENGRLSAKGFAKAFEDEVRNINLDFDTNIARALASGDWDAVFSNFSTLDEAVDKTSARIRELDGANGQLSRNLKDMTGVGKDAEGQMRAYADEVRRTGEETRAATEEEQRAVEKKKEHAEQAKAVAAEEKRIAAALRETAREQARVTRETERATRERARNTTETDKNRDSVGMLRRLLTRNGDRDGGGIGRMIDAFSGKWKEFSTAFPAEITILLRYFALLIGPIASLGSAIGAVLTSAVGALGVAIVGLAGAIAGIGVAAAYGVALAVKSFDVFKERFPQTQAALDSLKDSFENVDVPRFAQEWSDSLAKFAQTLGDSLRFDTVAENLGKATARITDAFTAVLQSPAWTNFVDAIEGPFSDSLSNLGTGMADVFGVLLQFMTAAAPLAVHLTDQFMGWAQHLNEFFASAAGQEALTNFFTLAQAALDQIVPLVSSLASALGNVFMAGADTGITFLGTLAQLAEQFNAWTSSIEGQNALAQWFAQGQSLMDAFIPLLGAVGDALNILVTPATIQSLVTFMNSLTLVLPIFAQMFAALNDLGILELFGSLLLIVAQAITPLIPAFSSLASILGGQLALVLSAIGPILQSVGQFFAAMMPAITPIISALGGALVTVLQALQPMFGVLAETLGGALTVALEAIAPLFALLPPIIIPLAQAFMNLLVPILPIVGDLLAAAAEVVGVLLQALTPLLPVIVLVADIIGQVLASAIDAVLPIFDILADTIVALSPIITMLADVLLDLLPVILPLVVNVIELSAAFLPILGLIPPLIGMLMPLIQMIIELSAAFLPLITTVLGFVTDLIPKITELATQLIDGLVNGLNTGITAVTDWITGFVDTFLTWFKDLFGIASPSTVFAEFGTMIMEGLVQGLESMMSALGEFFGTLWTNVSTWVTDGITNVLTFFAELPQKVIDAVTPLIEKIKTFFGDVFAKGKEAVTTGLRFVLDSFINFPQNVIDLVKPLIEKIKAFGSDVMNGLKAGFENGWTAVSTWVGGIADKVKGLVGDGGSILKQAGKNIIDGFLGGLKESWEKVKTFVGGLGQWIADHKGPRQVDLRLLQPAGGWIMQGLQKGIRDALPDLRRTLGDVSNALQVGGTSSFGVNPARAGGNSIDLTGLGGRGTTVASGAIQIITPVRDPAIVASMVLDGLVVRAQ